MSILVLTSDTLIGTPATGNLEYNGQFFGTDSNASRAQLQRIVQGTSVASTSGTSIDFTGIPSWVKKITVMYNGFSTNGTSVPIIQLGSGSPTTSGYLGSASQQSGSGVSVGNFTAGCAFCNTVNAATTQRGIFTCVNLSGNVWVISGTGAWSDNTVTTTTSSGVTLGGTLDRVRITTVNGTDAFDAGTINIIYEG